MAATLELDGCEMTLSEVPTVKWPSGWILGLIYDGDALENASMYAEVMNSVPSNRADRAEPLFYHDDVLYFVL